MTITVDFSAKSNLSSTGGGVSGGVSGKIWNVGGPAIAGGANPAWYGVAFGVGYFVAVSHNPLAPLQIIRSPDGWDWAQLASPDARTFKSIGYGDGVFCAVAEDGVAAGQIIRSTDGGATWAQRTAPSAQQWQGVCYCGSNVWVAVARDGLAGVQCARSVDHGGTWVSVAMPVAAQWSAVAANPSSGTVIAVNDNGGVGTQVARSVDRGANWVSIAEAATKTWTGIAFSPTVNTWSACASNNATSSEMQYSLDDGVTWTLSNGFGTPLGGICWGDPGFVAVAHLESHATSDFSPNGIAWTKHVTTVARYATVQSAFRSVTWGNGRYVAVGSGGLGFGNRGNSIGVSIYR